MIRLWMLLLVEERLFVDIAPAQLLLEPKISDVRKVGPVRNAGRHAMFERKSRAARLLRQIDARQGLPMLYGRGVRTGIPDGEFEPVR